MNLHFTAFSFFTSVSGAYAVELALVTNLLLTQLYAYRINAVFYINRN